MDDHKTFSFHELPVWHQAMLNKMMDAIFPGKEEISQQLSTAVFRFFDSELSLSIAPKEDSPKAPVIQNAPVQAMYRDSNGFPIDIILFVGISKRVYMLQILRMDSEPQKPLPPVNAFRIVIPSPELNAYYKK
jgi:hypothetical protein